MENLKIVQLLDSPQNFENLLKSFNLNEFSIEKLTKLMKESQNNSKEFQKQLYYATFQLILSKINKQFQKPSVSKSSKKKTLSIVNIQKRQEKTTSWSDFFIHYANESWKIKFFNQEKNEKIRRFQNLLNVRKILFNSSYREVLMIFILFFIQMDLKKKIRNFGSQSKSFVNILR
jgi:hypothetical protein